VTADPAHTPQDTAAEHAAPTPLVFELRLSPGDDLDGSIGPPAETTRLSFHGWIAFMSALNTLRATSPSAEPPD
jgi:hypothetical protein